MNTEQKLAHVEARARWALAGIKTIVSLGYAPAREFKRLRYLLERAYDLGIAGLPPRERIIARLAALEPRCIANWETEKSRRKKMRQSDKETKDPIDAILDATDKAVADKKNEQRNEYFRIVEPGVVAAKLELKALAAVAKDCSRLLDAAQAKFSRPACRHILPMIARNTIAQLLREIETAQTLLSNSAGQIQSTLTVIEGRDAYFFKDHHPITVWAEHDLRDLRGLLGAADHIRAVVARIPEAEKEIASFDPHVPDHTNISSTTVQIDEPLLEVQDRVVTE